jgi:hypothetical protein
VETTTGGNHRRVNALAPEVARHQEVPKRATFEFDSRRLHQFLGIFLAFQPEIPAASPF